MLALGADPNWQDKDNQLLTALHVSVMKGNVALSDLLLQNCADCDVVDANQWTPLHHAAKLDQVSSIILLIRRGVKLTVKDKEGNVC